MAVVYLGLGSNVGDRLANLEATLVALEPEVAIERRSSIYETMPAYLEEQPRFANMVVRGRTDLEPSALLRHVKTVEHRLGRRPGGPRNGPRPADVDILAYDQLVLDTPDLTIPHPRMLERSFVLTPLAEIAPELIHPVAGKRVDELLATAGPLLGEIAGKLGAG
jgi:2-amino-4-hydroxy-6-hydroxymethyldihydropteridine diphosphokinase